ncbi:hypothetical protein PH242_20265 [Photorhabdus bodei]|uniref:hypothetical protein n=1 Tax=Photorhabdus bodei TaxID=2029681 RepID=UPI00232D37F1|nr:hypothetical protein [Photorhabdus bodei]MDB6369920.1 hypothetical protein [Photorhabdus bodei]
MTGVSECSQQRGNLKDNGYRSKGEESDIFVANRAIIGPYHLSHLLGWVFSCQVFYLAINLFSALGSEINAQLSPQFSCW